MTILSLLGVKPKEHIHRFKFAFVSGGINCKAKEIGRCKCGQWAARNPGEKTFEPVEDIS